MERVVIALGGNALLRRGAEDTFEEMYRASRAAAERIADIAAAGWEVVVTHGNGPQVGRILLQQEAAKDVVHPMPLDVCGAESQGQIGYLLQVTIGDVFFERGMERPVATILTLTRVRPQDPAFRNPTKFVGPFYEEDEAKRLEDGTRVRDEGRPTRRLAPGRARRPNPYSIVETPGDRAPGERRDDRDRERRRRRSRDREGSAADRQGGRGRQGSGGGDPGPRGRRRRSC